MATHFNVLAWRILGTGDPGGLPPVGSHRVGHDWSDLAIAVAWRLYHILRKDWCWSWNSNTLTTWCEKLTHLKKPWCWERLKAGKGDNRGWDGWIASPTQWTWVWVSSRSQWWTGKPGVLKSMGSQRVRHDWGTELNWMILWQQCILLEGMSLLLNKNLLTNLAILRCMLCEWVW